MKVELVSIDRVIPYARNPRNKEGAVAKLVASIKEYGFRQPIVVDEEMVIIAGHTRLKAAQQLGLKKVPIHIADGLSHAQVKAYRIADNRTAEEAEWDDHLLAIELGELLDGDFDLELTGFDELELEKLLAAEAGEGLTEDDAVPEAPEVPTSKLGDIWVLGDHRLICGDSTDREIVDLIMDGQLADMVFTDPPYNIDYQGSATDRKKGQKRSIENDSLGDDFHGFLLAACQNMLAVNKGALYICMSSSELHTLFNAFTEAGGRWSTFIIWAKNHFTMGRSDYQRQYEPILYGWPDGAKHFWCGDRNQSDVWNYNRPQSNDLHPTMKPVELVGRAIQNSSKSRDIVFDPFGGSGSTLIAAEKWGRHARLIELDPKFVDVIVKRWEEYTGKNAILSGGKKTFVKITKERQAASSKGKE